MSADTCLTPLTRRSTRNTQPCRPLSAGFPLPSSVMASRLRRSRSPQPRQSRPRSKGRAPRARGSGGMGVWCAGVVCDYAARRGERTHAVRCVRVTAMCAGRTYKHRGAARVRCPVCERDMGFVGTMFDASSGRCPVILSVMEPPSPASRLQRKNCPRCRIAMSDDVRSWRGPRPSR